MIPAPTLEFAPHEPGDTRDYVAELWALALEIARRKLAADTQEETK